MTDYESDAGYRDHADHHTDMESDYSFLKSLKHPPKHAGESEGKGNVREHLTNRSGDGQANREGWKS